MYLYFGDGYSSVMSQLEKAKLYGPTFVIQKIEGVNHILRYYLRWLQYICSKTKMRLGDVPMVLSKLLSGQLQHFRCAITGAIKYRKSLVGINEQQRIRELRSDFHNGPFHVFGDHSKCPAREYFCNGSRSGDECLVLNMKSVGIWDEIMSANNILSHHSESIFRRFLDGKRVNFSLHGGYLTSELSAIYCNTDDSKLAEIHFKKLTKALANLQKKNLQKTKRKIKFSGKDSHYGIFPQTPGFNLEEYNKKKEQFLKGLQCDNNKILNIQLFTTGQKHYMSKTSDCFLFWENISHESNDTMLLEYILYSTFYGNQSTGYGFENEPNAIAQLEQEFGLAVNP
ncbi:hypothetical protein PR048_023405 [Dryococelus australis]|uniref:Mutator-like transposase domain-containing protein n=1 Tax=Dryococelus australis TaxID=614101 RepID=A0ABQ9GU03_9NEOP|nr:hypothetical protein PR048_023405 [Dryococelus australis]